MIFAIEMGAIEDLAILCQILPFLAPPFRLVKLMNSSPSVCLFLNHWQELLLPYT